ncbi:MAG: hypothetical protein ACM31O_01720 [Bacteroidota bacterium]
MTETYALAQRLLVLSLILSSAGALIGVGLMLLEARKNKGR